MSKFQWVASLFALAALVGVGSVLYFDRNKPSESDQPDPRANDDLWSGKGQPVVPLPANFKPADITGADLRDAGPDDAGPSGASSAEAAEIVPADEPLGVPTFRQGAAAEQTLESSK
jgi:hypothetical protein